MSFSFNRYILLSVHGFVRGSAKLAVNAIVRANLELNGVVSQGLPSRVTGRSIDVMKFSRIHVSPSQDAFPHRSFRPQQVLPVCSRRQSPPFPFNSLLPPERFRIKPIPPLTSLLTFPEQSGQTTGDASLIPCHRSNFRPHVPHSYS